jgi:threonine/homoserine/homoserine lactone efflux protein
LSLEAFLPDLSVLALFCIAALALLVVPGPSVLYIVTRSMDQGRTAGLVSVLGIHTGTLVHIGAAAAGVSAVLMSSALAFNVIRCLGAAYLIWLGIRRLRGRDEFRGPKEITERRMSRIYFQGAIVNVLNPKTALFFLAFLPQFVDVDNGAAWFQIVVFGLLFILLGILSDCAYALLASTLADRLRRSRRFSNAQRFFAGGTLVALGVTSAISLDSRIK